MNVRTIVFDEEGISIEYADDDTKSPIGLMHQLYVPYRISTLHPQLSNDLAELMEDAQAVLDGALQVRLSGGK